jgi:hypothetical protein
MISTLFFPASSRRYVHLVKLSDGRSRCDLCNKLFASWGNAVNHSQRLHEESESYECCICKKVIRNKLSFRTHINMAHGIRGKNLVKSYGKLVVDQM